MEVKIVEAVVVVVEVEGLVELDEMLDTETDLGRTMNSVV